jgi:hypothetical protein
MRHTTPEPNQVNTIFGSSYVPERHADETDRKLPPTDRRAIGIATMWLLFFILLIANAVVVNFGKVAKFAMAWPS